MNIISISTDRKIFEKGSPVSLRMIDYAKQYGEMHIIVFALSPFEEQIRLEARAGLSPYVKLSSNCFVYPTLSSLKFLYPLDAARIGREILKSREVNEITCQDPFLTAMAGFSIKSKSDVPIEIQIHTDIGSPDYGYTLGNRARKMMAKKYLPKADKIRVVSNRIKEYLVNILKIESSRIAVRPIAVDTERIKNAPITVDLRKKYAHFKRIVLMASRLEPEKNIGLAIHAWKDVLKAFPNAGLIIVGSGSQITNLKSLVARLDLQDSIVFENWASQATLASYYKTSDAFLNVSSFEGYGMTLVEAKAAGCRVISTDVGVARETGAIIVPVEVGPLAQAIVKAIE